MALYPHSCCPASHGGLSVLPPPACLPGSPFLSAPSAPALPFLPYSHPGLLPTFPDVSWFLLSVPPVLLRHLLTAALRIVDLRPLGLRPYLLQLSTYLRMLSPFPLLLRLPTPPPVTTAFLQQPHDQDQTQTPRRSTSSQIQVAYWLQEAVPAVTSSGQEEVSSFLPPSCPPALVFPFLLSLYKIYSVRCIKYAALGRQLPCLLDPGASPRRSQASARSI